MKTTLLLVSVLLTVAVSSVKAGDATTNEIPSTVSTNTTELLSSEVVITNTVYLGKHITQKEEPGWAEKEIEKWRLGMTIENNPSPVSYKVASCTVAEILGVEVELCFRSSDSLTSTGGNEPPRYTVGIQFPLVKW